MDERRLSFCAALHGEGPLNLFAWTHSSGMEQEKVLLHYTPLVCSFHPSGLLIPAKLRLHTKVRIDTPAAFQHVIFR